MDNSMEVYVIKESKKSVSFENIPEYAVGYLAYGDATGLEDEDIKVIDEWCRENGIDHLTNTGEERHFSPHPEFGLAADCIDATFLVNDREIVKEELNLVPEFTGNTWKSEDEIQEAYWEGGEDTGIRWNKDLEKWEMSEEDFNWWKEVADGRQKAYAVFEDYGKSVDTEGRNGWYGTFLQWHTEKYSRYDKEEDKEMAEHIPEFIDAIRDGEIEGIDKPKALEIAEEIEGNYNERNLGLTKPYVLIFYNGKNDRLANSWDYHAMTFGKLADLRNWHMSHTDLTAYRQEMKKETYDAIRKESFPAQIRKRLKDLELKNERKRLWDKKVAIMGGVQPGSNKVTAYFLGNLDLLALKEKGYEYAILPADCEWELPPNIKRAAFVNNLDEAVDAIKNIGRDETFNKYSRPRDRTAQKDKSVGDDGWER